MARRFPLRAVVTGGPGTGKSTLLAAAGVSGIVTFPEVARDILQSPGGMELRERDPDGFAAAMLEREIAAFEQSAGHPGPALFDRGFPDIAGFHQVLGREVPRELDRICRELRYDGPIFRAPPWREIYAQDSERIQSWDEALASDAAVAAAWRSYGYSLTDLPLVSVEERLAFVMDRLSFR